MARKTPIQNSLQGRFHSTIAQSTRFRAEDQPPFGDQPKGRYARRGRREDYNINVSEGVELANRNPTRAGREIGYWKTRAQRGIKPGEPGPAIAELDEDIQRPRVSRTDTELIRRAQRERSWRSEPNVYRAERGQRKSAAGFIREDATPSHRDWIESQMQNPNSEFNQGLDLNKEKTGKYTSAQRRRLQRYTDALQGGASHQEALQQVRSTRLRESVGRPTQRVLSQRQSQARQVVSKTRAAGRPTRLSPTMSRADERTLGVSAGARPQLQDVKQRFPDLSEQEAIRVQQAGTELISQDMLANLKWAHETRRANLLGQKSGKVKEDPDKVTIFTTNLGHPTVSLPADSLVGQYIIRKRKSILGGAGVPSSQLKGKFPDAVRDAHIVDVATGASVGIKGSQGVFNSTGYRFGKRSSAGYGRPRPLGAHILYDSAGRPLYDAQGNIRYSEGATRPIDWTTPNVGFRVLIG